MSHVKDRAPVILLAHEPDIFTFVPPSVTLTLAGHTHGGQVYIPFMGRPGLMLGSTRSAKYAYGHFHEGRAPSDRFERAWPFKFPIRFLVPPEIAIVTLRGVPTCLNPLLTAKG